MAFTDPTTQLHPTGVMGIPYVFLAKSAFVLGVAADQTLVGQARVTELASDRIVDLVGPPDVWEGID